MKIHLAVEIETAQGFFRRTNSEPYNVIVENGAWEPKLGMLYYPDRRAKKMKVFAEDGGNFRLVRTVDLFASRRDNYAFALVDSIDLSTFESEELLPVIGYNDDNEIFDNRIRVSETNQPFILNADKTYYLSEGSGNKVTAFATNTIAVSEGQFGQYPVYVFCEDAIYALEQGGDPLIAFERVTPVSLSHGAKSQKQVVNIGQSITFVYGDSIYILRGVNTDSISDPINKYPGKSSVNFDQAVLASKKRGEDNELLVSDGDRCYVYNINYGRWYTSSKVREMYFRFGSELYGLSQGIIYDENKYMQGNVPFTIEFSPIHFLSPDMLKRLFSVYVRGDVDDLLVRATINGKQFSINDYTLRIKHKSAYDFTVKLSGTIHPENEYLHELTLQAEQRYPHRNRRRR